MSKLPKRETVARLANEARTYKARHNHVRIADARAEALRAVIEQLDPNGVRRPSHVANDLMLLGLLTVGGSATWDATAVLRLEARLGIRRDPKRLNRRELTGRYHRTPEERTETVQKTIAARERARVVRRWNKGKAKAKQQPLQELVERARAKLLKQ